MNPRERILHLLKTEGARTAGELARSLGVTAMAVRQQLARLEAEGRIAPEDRRQKVGRPARYWSLTEAASGAFPDRHAELSVSLLDSLRAVYGPGGLDRLVEERTRRQLADYRRRLPPARAPLGERVAALARIRAEEGYMADSRRERDGSYLLVENHCPICAAARCCQGLCSGELDLFRSVLGPKIVVERIEHALGGDRRCAYRIEPA